MFGTMIPELDLESVELIEFWRPNIFAMVVWLWLVLLLLDVAWRNGCQVQGSIQFLLF